MQPNDTDIWECWCESPRLVQLGELAAGLCVSDIHLNGYDAYQLDWCAAWIQRMAYMPLRDIFEVTRPVILFALPNEAATSTWVQRITSETKALAEEYGHRLQGAKVVAVPGRMLRAAWRQTSNVVAVVSAVTDRSPLHDDGLRVAREGLREKVGNAGVVIESRHVAFDGDESLVLLPGGTLDVTLHQDGLVLPSLKIAGDVCYAPDDR